MTELVMFAVLLVLLWGILFLKTRNDRPNISFLDREHTNILKGYAIFLILLGHTGQYLGINGIEYPAGVGVSIFLILSGYGIACSYQKNGLEHYWEKRVQRVWTPYFLSNMVFIVISSLDGKSYTWANIILNFTLIKPLYAFGWYLRYILVCYIIFYIVYKLSNTRKARGIAIIVCYASWFIIRSTVIIDSTPFLQARQMLAFPLGILLAEISNYMRNRLQYEIHGLLPMLCIGIGTGIYGFLHVGIITIDNLLLYNMFSLFTCVLCAIGIIGLTFQWEFLQNKGMYYISIISYEIYLTHGYVIDAVNLCTICGLFEFVSITAICSIMLHISINALSILKKDLKY